MGRMGGGTQWAGHMEAYGSSVHWGEGTPHGIRMACVPMGAGAHGHHMGLESTARHPSARLPTPSPPFRNKPLKTNTALLCQLSSRKLLV